MASRHAAPPGALPEDKFAAWSLSLATIIKEKATTKAALDTLEGQLDHSAYVIPLAREFLPRIQEHKNCRSNKKSRIGLNKEALEDLVLWQGLLDIARNGILMNLIVTRQPNRLIWLDSRPFGIGGFRLHSGKGWRIQIPTNSILYSSDRINNLLEFTGMAVNVWLECRDAKAHSHLCILALGDNTSAFGWLHISAQLDTKLTAHAPVC
jgi:hypothetical protein